MALKVSDYGDVLPVARIRAIFEKLVCETPTLATKVQLNMWHGEYACPETQTLFVGFSIGLRCAERFQRAGIPIE